MTMTPADQAYVEEFAADSADLMRRALAYAAQKRAEERAKIMGVVEPAARAGRKASANALNKARSTAANAQRYEFRGEQRSIGELSIEFGIPPGVIYQRIKALGWTIERAVTTPTRSLSRRSDRG